MKKVVEIIEIVVFFMSILVFVCRWGNKVDDIKPSVVATVVKLFPTNNGRTNYWLMRKKLISRWKTIVALLDSFKYKDPLIFNKKKMEIKNMKYTLNNRFGNFLTSQSKIRISLFFASTGLKKWVDIFKGNYDLMVRRCTIYNRYFSI